MSGPALFTSDDQAQSPCNAARTGGGVRRGQLHIVISAPNRLNHEAMMANHEWSRPADPGIELSQGTVVRRDVASRYCHDTALRWKTTAPMSQKLSSVKAPSAWISRTIALECGGGVVEIVEAQGDEPHPGARPGGEAGPFAASAGSNRSASDGLGDKCGMIVRWCVPDAIQDDVSRTGQGSSGEGVVGIRRALGPSCPRPP